MMLKIQRLLVVAGAVLILMLPAPQQAAAGNAFSDFFSNLGNAINDGGNKKKRKSTNFGTQDPKKATPAPRKVKAANPKLRNTQAALNKIGFKAGKPDGIYGKRTGQAIGQFQTAIGNPATGRLTAEERDILLARARDAKQVASTSPAPGQQQALQSPDAALKDTLPQAGQNNYFDADEPEDDTLPPKPTSSN
jgi:peptidoglycan hydrolase-like protein with peptidoglycan-binding domain